MTIDIAEHRLDNIAGAAHSAQWEVARIWPLMTPLQRSMFIEWLKAAMQKAKEKQTADSIEFFHNSLAEEEIAKEARKGQWKRDVALERTESLLEELGL